MKKQIVTISDKYGNSVNLRVTPVAMVGYHGKTHRAEITHTQIRKLQKDLVNWGQLGVVTKFNAWGNPVKGFVEFNLE